MGTHTHTHANTQTQNPGPYGKQMEWRYRWQDFCFHFYHVYMSSPSISELLLPLSPVDLNSLKMCRVHSVVKRKAGFCFSHILHQVICLQICRSSTKKKKLISEINCCTASMNRFDFSTQFLLSSSLIPVGANRFSSIWSQVIFKCHFSCLQSWFEHALSFSLSIWGFTQNQKSTPKGRVFYYIIQS